MKKLGMLTLAAAMALGASPCYTLAKDKPTPEEAFKRMDKDGDGKLSLAEFKGKKDAEKAAKAEEVFKKKDKDADGYLTLQEFMAGGKKK